MKSRQYCLIRVASLSARAKVAKRPEFKCNLIIKSAKRCGCNLLLNFYATRSEIDLLSNPLLVEMPVIQKTSTGRTLKTKTEQKKIKSDLKGNLLLFWIKKREKRIKTRVKQTGNQRHCSNLIVIWKKWREVKIFHKSIV